VRVDSLEHLDSQEDLVRPVHQVGQVQSAVQELQVVLDLPDLALLDHRDGQVFEVLQEVQGVQVNRIVIAR